MDHNKIENALHKFIGAFNAMCKKERRDILLRERTVTYESSSSIKTYYVTYAFKKYGDTWKIFGLSDGGFWIFRKKFPLFDMVKTKEGIQFKGLYTSTIPMATQDNIEACLEKYIEVCKTLPQNAFINS